MDEILYHEQLKCAKAGNFPAFCFISPEFESLQEAKLSFDLLRENLIKNKIKITEAEETWFDMNEFIQYSHSNDSSNGFEMYLTETANTSSRMKMKRAAIRTAKRRARKRFMRRMIRRNSQQLRKRAYGQVKSILRKKLSGNRPWSSIPLSSRVRIDAIINKRKPILNRMIKNRMPAMQRQENQRLQNVRKRSLNNSYEIPVASYLLEKNKDPTGTERKRRFDRRNREDPARFLNRVRLVRSKKTGKRMLVDRDSVNNSHIVEANDQMNLMEAKNPRSFVQVCNNVKNGNSGYTSKDFDKTPTFLSLCGNIQFPAVDSIKTTLPQESSSDSSPVSGIASSEFPTPEPNGELADATATEQINVFVANLRRVETDAFANIKPSMVLAQTAYKRLSDVDGQFGKPKPEEYDALEKVSEIAKQHKLSPAVLEKILDKDASFDVAVRVSEGIDNIPGLQGYLFFATGTESHPARNGYSVTGKTDIRAIPLAYLQQKGYIKADATADDIRKGFDDFLTDYGKLIKSKSKKPQANEKKFKELDEIYQATISISQKTGQARGMSGSLTEGGDGLVLLEFLQQQNIDPEIKELIGDFVKNAKENLSRISTRGTISDIQQSGQTDERIAQFLESKDEFARLLDEITKNDEVKARIIFYALSGAHQFDPNQPGGRGGLATNLLSISEDGKEVKFGEITMELAREMAKDTRIYISTKSSSDRTQAERSNVENYGTLEEEFFRTRKITEGSTRQQKQDAELDFLKKVYKIHNQITDYFKASPSIPYETMTQKYLNNNSLDGMDDMDRRIIELAVRPPLRYTWTILNTESLPATQQRTQVEEKNFRFSHNRLIRMLLEINEILPNTIEAKQKNETEELAEHQRKIYEILFEYAGTDLNKIMELLDVSIDRISMDPIDVSRYLPSRGDGRYNSIYVDGKYHQVPLIVSERYREIGKAFLQENKKRNYRSEYDNYHSQPEQIKRRSARNMARRWAERKGLVRKGDGKDIDHKNSDPTDNSPKNLRVRDRSKNRADNE